MKTYLDIAKNIINKGSMVYNERTKSNCLVLLNQSIVIDVGKNEFPILTTRKMNWKSAILEMICYIRGYYNLNQFHSLGVHTWDANCNAWNSPNKQSKTDCGIIYGASAKAVGYSYEDVLEDIKNKPHDRGIIWNFWNPEYFDEGCLRPCMYSHQFNVIGDTLYLTSTQRSADFMLGSSWNIIQCYFLLAVTAHLTGLKAGTATLNMVNCHIYENQLELAKEHITREPSELKPVLVGLSIDLDTLLRSPDPLANVQLLNYEPQEPIKYPFTV